jgi:hypothetical protein
MDFAIFGLCGFIILFLIYLYYLKQNIKKNRLIIFGSLLITVGYFVAAYEKYEYLNKKPPKNISISHLILGASPLLSFIIPINIRSKKTDIFGIIEHFILINVRFGYEEIGHLSLMIYYLLYTYRNALGDRLSNVRAVGGGLVLLYYIKLLIDDLYIKKENDFNDELNYIKK